MGAKSASHDARYIPAHGGSGRGGRRRATSLGTSRLKVVYLDHCAEISGGEIALVRLIGALKDVEAHVILAEDGPLRQRLEAAGATVEVMPLDQAARDATRLAVRPGLASVRMGVRVLSYSWRLGRRIRHLKPDLVHTNSLKSAVYGTLAARFARVPVICHLRDRLTTDYMSPSAAKMMRVVLRVFPDAVIANSRSTMATLGRTSSLRVSRSVMYDAVPSLTGETRL